MPPSSATSLSPVWVVIPAAGLGARMGGALPKQYLPLAGKTLLEITLEKMLALPELAGVVVAVNDGDTHWQALNLERLGPVHRAKGGRERADSVLSCLDYLNAHGVPSDHWVLVHDAARPCVQSSCISQLRRQVEQTPHASGGILAKPVADTLKRVDDQRIDSTCDRRRLWQAHTPQMFRLAELRSALRASLEARLLVTDEASAMEQQGAHPLVVEDRRDNIKVTHPEDLAMAEMILRCQQKEATR